MTDRDTLYRGLSHAAWGYLFLNLDINLGTVSILPRFVGYLLFRAAIDELRATRRDLDGHVLFLDLLAAVIGIYFQFQFLTDVAALAEANQPPGNGLDGQILHWRTVETVLVTALCLTGHLPEALGSWRELLTGALAVVYVIVGLCLMGAMFSLRKLFQPVSPEGTV